MMNVLAISLVLISLVTAGALENPNQNQNQNPNMIVKEGHRVVVVEYEKEDGNTKVVISPDAGSYIHAAGEKILEVTSDIKDRVIDSASDVKDKVKDAASGPRKLICDAFGKWKHKIASALGKTKDMVSETAHGVSEKVHENVEEAYEKAKDVVRDKTHQGIDKVKDAASGPRKLICNAFGKWKHKIASALGKTKDMVSETAHGVSEKVHENVEEAYEKAKDVVRDKTHQGIDKAKEMGEGAKDIVDDAKETGKGAKDKAKEIVAKKAKSFDAVDSPKRIGEDIGQNVSRDAKCVSGELKEKAKKAREAVEEKAKQGGEAVVGTSGKNGLKGILNLGREFVYNFIWYVLPLKSLDSAVDVVHLMGISSAYGMCLFVSFVSSYVLSRVLTKQQFGMVQSRLYPVYHKALTVCLGLGLVMHLLGQRRRVLSNKLEMFQALDLIAALATVIGNSVFLEPRATKQMFERMKFDKEEGKGGTEELRFGVAGGTGDPVCLSSAIGAVETREEPGERQAIVQMTERLKKLNMYSSILNMMTLIFLSWHIVYLGHRLQLTR